MNNGAGVSVLNETPLEDEFEDVLTKAAVGQGTRTTSLSRQCLPLMTVQGLFRGSLF